MATNPFPVSMSALLGKFLIIAALVLLLSGSLVLISFQIDGRSHRQDQVTEEIALQKVSSQILRGPILLLQYSVKKPVTETYYDSRVKDTLKRVVMEIQKRQSYVTAENQLITGTARVEADTLKRGIYKVPYYELDLDLAGRFKMPGKLVLSPEEKLVGIEASVLVSVTDLRGVDRQQVKVGAREYEFVPYEGQQRQVEPEAGPASVGRLGDVMADNILVAKLGTFSEDGLKDVLDFSVKLGLTGTKSFALAPTARDTELKLVSDWPHPNFGGSFLPTERSVSKAGFKANWKVNQIQRNLEAALKSHNELLQVSFHEPINIYSLSDRATRYGVLFILLTFATFFLLEVLRGKATHPVQYLLVGLALAIFFLLLIALSEHVAFIYAYAAGALACVGLITTYLAGVYRSWRTALGLGAELAALYGMLYLILQSEDFALLAGTLLSFVVLAIIMLLTRKINWSLSGEADGNEKRQPVPPPLPVGDAQA